MNKIHVYKSLGVIESYIMFLNDKLDSTTSDYVMTHLDLLQKWVDESVYCIKVLPHECHLTDDKQHKWYNGKCDYCGKVKDELS